MIDIHDLRAGNWVYDGERTQFPMYVQTIGEDYVYLNFDSNEGDVWESTPEELRGIPLTEGIMNVNGFRFQVYMDFGVNDKLHLILNALRVFDIEIDWKL